MPREIFLISGKTFIFLPEDFVFLQKDFFLYYCKKKKPRQEICFVTTSRKFF